MSDRPTPETDALADSRIGMWQYHLPADFARKLERQRDEAREELINLRVENDHNWQANADLEEMIKLARELRDALERASDLLERAGLEQGTTWEPGQSWIFREDKCAAKNDVEAIRGMLAKAKEVLP